MHRTLVTTSILFLAFVAAAAAEVQVSVTLSGDVDEILAVLVQLREMGLIQADVPQDDSTRIQVHSITVGSLDETAATAAPAAPVDEATPQSPLEAPAPAEPRLELAAPTLTPGSVRAGETVLIAVPVVDTERRVDTLAVQIATPAPIGNDLFDNGGDGDAIAGDGVWSRTVALPADLPVGEYAIKVIGYDRDGAAINVGAQDDPEAVLQTHATLVVEP